jgi:hypothetical protein
VWLVGLVSLMGVIFVSVFKRLSQERRLVRVATDRRSSKLCGLVQHRLGRLIEVLFLGGRSYPQGRL